MSLTPCKGCGTPIDPSAKACPKCGRSRPAIGNGLKAVLGVAVLVALGAVWHQCSSGVDRIKSVDRPAVVLPSPPVASPPVASPPAPARARLSIASFKDDILKECDDIEVDSTSAMSDGGAVDTLKVMREGLLKAAAKHKPVELSRPCAEQFSDREPMGACSFASKGDRHSFRGRIAIYTYEDAFETDAFMKECLSDWHGEWTAVRRDSLEYLRAKHDYVSRKLASEARRARAR